MLRKLLIKKSLLYLYKFRCVILFNDIPIPIPPKEGSRKLSFLPTKITLIKVFHSLKRIHPFLFPIDSIPILIQTIPRSSFFTRTSISRRPLDSSALLLIRDHVASSSRLPIQLEGPLARASINRCKNRFVLVTRLKKRLKGGGEIKVGGGRLALSRPIIILCCAPGGPRDRQIRWNVCSHLELPLARRLWGAATLFTNLLWRTKRAAVACDRLQTFVDPNRKDYIVLSRVCGALFLLSWLIPAGFFHAAKILVETREMGWPWLSPYVIPRIGICDKASFWRERLYLSGKTRWLLSLMNNWSVNGSVMRCLFLSWLTVVDDCNGDLQRENDWW